MGRVIKLAALFLVLFSYSTYSQINFPSRHFLQKTDIKSLTQNNHQLDSLLQSRILNKLNKTGGEIFLISDETGLIWDTVNLDWKNSYKYSYTYDAYNNRIDLLLQEWDGANWYNSRNDTSIYDTNNNQIVEFYQQWDGANWMDLWTYSYTYDTNNNLIVVLVQQWDGTNWVNTWKHSNTYNTNKKLIMELEQQWDGSNWIDVWKYSVTYDTNNNLMTLLWQQWYGANWIDVWKYSYTYDNNNNLIVKLVQKWNPDLSNVWRYSYTYDNNNNLIVELYQYWDGINWIDGRKYFYTYDTNNNLITLLFQEWDGANWVNAWAWKHIFTYMEVTGITGQSETIPKDFSLSQNYPNPFNPSTVIKYDLPKESFVTIKVYDLLGREVKTLLNENKAAGSYSFNFNSGNLPSGIYFYSLQSDDFVQTKKMVLLK